MKSLKYIIAIAALLTLCVSCSKENEYDIYATITGKVVDANTNQPIEGVNVTLYPGTKTYTTKSDGIFEFYDLEANTYTINADAQIFGYKQQSEPLRVRVLSGENKDNITIFLQKKSE